MHGSPGPTSHTSPHWWPLNQCVDAISNFLGSINRDDFKDGLVYFDPLEGKLIRRFWLSNPTIQSVVNIRNPQATFTETKNGFEFLNGRVACLWEQLFACNASTLRGCPAEAVKLAARVCRDIPRIVEEIAKLGLAQLKENYENALKENKGKVLDVLGKQAFGMLARCDELWMTKLLIYLPDPKALYPVNERLSSLIENKAVFEEQHESLRLSLRQVTWNPQCGSTIPELFLSSCLQNGETGSDREKRFLRLKANYLGFPSKAKSIPVQGGETHWHPVCVVKDERSGKYEIRQGVVGTCQRDGLSNGALCNFYYQVNPLTSHLFLTCGMINSDQKIEELGAALAHIQTQKPESFKNGRWIIHSVGSSAEVFKASRALVSQNSLARQINAKDFSALHFHTCFDKALTESARPFHAVNVENLAFLIKHVLADAAQLLLKNKLAGSLILPKDGKSFLSEQSALVISLAKELQQMNGQFKEGEVWSGFEQFVDKQTTFRNELIKMADYLRIAIELLEKVPKDKDVLPLEQTMLLFKTARQILVCQFERNDIGKALPLGQLECLLLLYRLLDFKVVLISEDGLDEGSAAAAIFDAQSQIERMFYQENLRKKCTPPLAMLNARHKLLDLICKLPEERDNLFRRFTFSHYKGISTAKFDHLKAAPDDTVRDVLMKEIEQYPSPQKESLTHALFYMELVLVHLLSSAEKNLNSSGVARLSIQSTDSFNRMAPFASCGRVTIHLSDLSESKAFDSTIVTDIGKAILMPNL